MWIRICILDESQISTDDVSTECDTGKTKITCAASFEHDLTRLNGLTIKAIVISTE